MKYKNAADILPDKLLREIQKYASGEAIYIPRAEEKSGWGMKSGARAYYKKRNAQICARYAQGADLETLAAEFALTPESIRKILYAGRKAEEKTE
ncbi:MAG: hypothetical protein IJF56_02295 [Clostridia bacterium]|nr:hypothetical protein [Clostridia bacterium]